MVLVSQHNDAQAASFLGGSFCTRSTIIFFFGVVKNLLAIHRTIVGIPFRLRGSWTRARIVRRCSSSSTGILMMLRETVPAFRENSVTRLPGGSQIEDDDVSVKRHNVVSDLNIHEPK
jgi:hypothetical protein